MPQSLGLYEDLTVAENLAFSAAAYGSADARLEGELAEARDTLVRDLPLGLRRRAAFAIALGHHPDLLVLDEPTSGVDPLQRARLWETIGPAPSTAPACSSPPTTSGRPSSATAWSCWPPAAWSPPAPWPRSSATPPPPRSAPPALGGRLRHDQAGLPVSLVGRTLRVPAADPAAVHQLLTSAGVPAEVTVPASFEETFVVLAA